ncbi:MULTISPECIES: putative holin-like toxin [Bacillus subtilis group]|nr:putative holin-like toxin [Bacillus subtilis]
MKNYQAIHLMLTFGMFTVSLIALVVSLIILGTKG